MRKKLPVSIFIKDIMEAKEIKKSSIYNTENISRQTVENILEKNANISVDNAIVIADILGVKPSLLLNLDLLYKKYQNHILACESIIKSLKGTKNKIDEKEIYENDQSKFLLFSKNPNQYVKSQSLFFYMPNSANLAKQWLFMRNVFDLESIGEFDEEKFMDYMYNQYTKDIENIKSKNNCIEFIVNLKEDLFNMGVHFKVISSRLNTTVKGVSSLKDGPKLIVEAFDDFPTMIWYLTHELMHIVHEIESRDMLFKVDEKNEALINELTLTLLLGENKNYLDIHEGILEQFIEKNNMPLITSMIFKSSWGFRNNQNQKYRKQLEVDKNDLL